jgi:hypothetical protein
MQQYLVIAFTRSNQIAGVSEIIECADDTAAIERTRGMVDGYAVELWQGARKIVRFEPETDLDPPGYDPAN